MLIYIETNRIALNEFEFIHSYYVGLSSVNEQIDTWTEPENDRLRAAIVNVGFALNAIAGYEGNVKVIGLPSDKDGKDILHGGEHDILFSLLAPRDDFEARKHLSLYHAYERYLGRCKLLMLRHDIRIVLQDRGEDRVRYA